LSQADIIQVSAYYPPHLGGQEYVVRSLATQLVGAGRRVRVLASALGGGQAGFVREEGVEVHRLRAVEFGHAAIMPEFVYWLFRAAGRRTVVHIHIGQAFTPEMVWLVSRLRRFRYVAELHIDFEPSGPAGVLLTLYKRLVLKRVLNAAAAVVVLNDKTLSTVRQTYGYRGQALVMSNGIDEAYFKLGRAPLAKQPPQTLRLLFVGRLSKQKNLPVLLEALKHTTRKVSLDIVGAGEEAAAVQELIAQLGLANVTMRGRLPRHEVLRLYATHDALVLPSLYEAQPLVLLEAMATRIPIIGTSVVGVGEHVRGGGIVVEPTAEGLAAGFDQYYRQYDKLPALVERSFTKASQLRWSRLLKHYERLYDDVASA